MFSFFSCKKNDCKQSAWAKGERNLIPNSSSQLAVPSLNLGSFLRVWPAGCLANLSTAGYHLYTDTPLSLPLSLLLTLPFLLYVASSLSLCASKLH